MSKSITILDKDYTQWVKVLVIRYRQSQIKAAVQVNSEQLRFNWLLGHDIVEMKVEERWGEGVIAQLSDDLKKAMPQVEGLSITNLRYCRRFYLLYSHLDSIHPQLGGESNSDTYNPIRPQYALESSNQPIVISEYDLEKVYPEKIEGTIPTIKEIEEKIGE